jgi:uncharacterized iron-regulated membrane protein
LRRILFWTHLSAGLVAGLVIIVMSATGVALTYQRQMQAWADRGDWRPPASGRPLPVDELISRVHQELPDATITSVTLRSASDQLATLAVTRGPAPTLQIDPYTGAVVPLGPRAAGMRAFFRSMTDWHRWLARSGDSRASGRAVTGAANLMFLFIVLSGLVLWWPRQLSRRAFAAVTWFRRPASARARDFNWHNVTGFWTAIPLAAIVASGAVISYSWAGNLVYRMSGEAPPVPAAAAGGTRAQGERSAPPDPAGLPLARAVQSAAARVPDWRSLAIRLPNAPAAPFSIAIDRGTGGQPQLRGTLTADASSGEVTRWEPFESQTRGRRWRAYLRFAHTGEVLGITGQTVAGIASAGAVFLAYTGVSLSLRRFGAWTNRRRRDDTGSVDESQAA